MHKYIITNIFFFISKMITGCYSHMLHDIICISLFKREKNIFARTTICVQIPMNNNVIQLVIGSMLHDCFCTNLMCKMA